MAFEFVKDYLNTYSSDTSTSALSDDSDVTLNDKGVYTNLNVQEVIVSCKGKHRAVRSFLDGNLKIKGESEWEDMFGGGVTAMAGTLLNTADRVVQLSMGKSIQQPWFNRKFWKNSKPFPLNFTLNFVAETSAKDEVYDPCVALLSFCYPRKSTGTAKEHMTAKKLMASSDTGVIPSFADALSVYTIPGPSLFAQSNGTDDKGDTVTIQIGNSFVFGHCYLSSVDVEFSKVFSSDGYPLSAKATLSATCLDAVVCEEDGSFLISAYPQATDKVGTAMTALSTLINTAISNVQTVYEHAKGFYTASGDDERTQIEIPGGG